MAALHPDKLVGLTRAILSRPRQPRPSINVAAQRVAGGAQRQYLGKPSIKREPGLIENLAFQLRADHEERHLNRIARRVDSAVKPQQAPAVGAGKPAQGQIEPPHVEVNIRQPGPLTQGKPASGGRKLY